MALIADANYESVMDVYMEDMDGSGFSLTIPCMMISKENGKLLKREFEKGSTIDLQAKLEIAHSMQNVADLTLYYGSILDLSTHLIEELYDWVHLMKDFVKFSPRILTMECPSCIGDVRDRTCFSNGLYCLMPPKDDIGMLFPKLTNRALLEENLYERCVWDIISSMKEVDGLRYFNYLYNIKK